MKLAASASSTRFVRRVRVDDLVQNLSAGRDDDDQHARPVELHEVDVAQPDAVAWRPDRDPDMVRGPREFVRGMIEQILDRARASQPRFDVGRQAARACATRGACPRRAGSRVGRCPASRRVGLADQSLLLQAGKDIADGCRRAGREHCAPPARRTTPVLPARCIRQPAAPEFGAGGR